MKKLKIFSLLAILGLAYFAYDQWKYAPRLLFFGIESGMSQADLSNYLDQIKVPPANVEKVETGNDDFPHDTLVIKEFQYEALIGNLEIEFFQDDLCAISYFPDNYKSFVNTAHPQANPTTGVTVTMDLSDAQGNEGVTWQDQAREDNMNWWVLQRS